MNRRNKSNVRRGATAVEMAIVLPIILVFFFGLWEWSRVEMIRQVTESAAFTSARQGTLPGATPEELEDAALEILDMYFIKDAEVNATIDFAAGTSIVEVAVPLDQNLWIAGNLFAGKEASSTVEF